MGTGEAQRQVKVLIVDDDALVRAAVTGILNSDASIDVVRAVSSGAEAVEFVRSSRPDVVLMDIQMPGMDGIDATKALLAIVDTQVIAMTSLTSHDTVQRMLGVGAYGYLLKDSAPTEFVEAVHMVARGDAFLSPGHTRGLIERLGSEADRSARDEAAELFATLTDRERDAARLIAIGATDAEIALRMHVAPTTVKTHVQQTRLKLGVRNRTQIAVLVERAGETPQL